MSDLSVLVVAYRRPDLLGRCLASVRTHLPDAAVHVWDNSGPGVLEPAEMHAVHPGVELEVSPVNVGFAAAVNRLAERSGPDDLLLLNPDAELLGPLVRTRAALDDPQVAAAAPMSADDAPGATPWDVAHRAPTLPRAWVAHSGYAPALRGRRVSDRYASPPTTVGGYLTGSCLLIRRAAWDDVGPFDEEFFLYGEEADWQHRARAAGWRLVLADEPAVRHTGHGTVAGDPAAAQRSRDLLRANVALGLDRARGARRGDAFLAGMAVLDRVQRSSRIARRRPAGARPDVLISVNQLVRGGAERQHVRLAGELAERGHRVTIVCLQRLGPLLAEIPPAVRVVRQPWWAPLVDIADGPAVLIGGDTNTEAGFATLWRRGAHRHRRRWVVGAHVPPAPDGPTYSAGLTRALRGADGFVALAPAHWHELARRHDLGRRWFVAPNGTVPDGPGLDAVENRRRDPSRPLQLVMLSRIVEHKNPHALVAALDGLRHRDWELSIFGDGPDRARLEALTPADLRDRVHWRGWSPGPEDALRDCDLLCVPSAVEAFPMVILEAMARAIPVAATAVCAVPDLLDGGRAGVLVPTVDAWRATLDDVLADPARLPALGLTGLARMRANYTSTAMADAYEAIIDAVLR